ncbi:MAG TPA: aminoglycoside phosphotransferase family protein [Solirubrobacterales bacterium]
MALRLTDGTTVTDLVEPPQGIRHRLLFGVEQRSGREVAVKVELIDGALADERRALEWLTEQDAPAPRLRAACRLDDSGEHPGAACLIVDRVAGGPTSSLAAWGRLGRALARLAEVPWEGSGLTVLDHDAFRDLHERRVADLSTALGRDVAASLPPLPDSYAEAPLVITHGDPGPGNFVDDGVEGTLVDWEDAVVAPRGLDLGRARFIALLGVGPEGWVAEELEERAGAATAGFLAEIGALADAADRPAGEAAGGVEAVDAVKAAATIESELDWWLAFAGVQFAHWRLERSESPRVPPWLDAMATLESAFPAR